MNFIKKEYIMQYNFFREELKKIFWICFAMLFVSGIVMYFVCLSAPDRAQDLITSFYKAITDAGVIDDNGNISTLMLFFNNFKSSLFTTAYGIVPFLFLPLLGIFSNGAIMGAVYAVMGSQGLGSTILSFLVGIAPHGIFEIPAFIMATSLGVYLCLTLCRKITKRDKRGDKPSVIVLNILRTYVLIILPALIIAAIIEVNITPMIMNATGF